MDVPLDFRKSTQENAAHFFEQAKKARKKIGGAEETIEKTKEQLAKVVVKEEKKIAKAAIKKEWYEKFRWFFTSTGFLVIGGRDATSNEIVIKKHTDKEDVVFHTDMAGSPFFVLKTEGKKVDKQTLREVADATATFSRAWKLGLQSQDVLYVKPEQVTKEAQPGEYLQKGAFMIRGNTTYVENRVSLCIGLKDGKLMAGPCESVKKHCEQSIELKQGNKKVSDVAKKIKKKLGGELDDIIRVLAAGTYA